MGSDKRNPISDYPGGLIDFTESSRAAGPMLLYCFMGAIDAYYQSFAYWIIGTMTNRPQMLARYAGFYKEIQSMAMGAVVAWQLDAKHVKLLTQYSELNQIPSASNIEPGYLYKLLLYEAPEEPESFEDIKNDISNKIMPGITHWQSSNFFGYFQCNSSFPAMLGDMYSAMFNTISFSWKSSPATTELETIILDWLGRLIGLGKRFLSIDKDGTAGVGGGIIQGTASEAQLIVLVAARKRMVAHPKSQGAGDEEAESMQGKFVAYVSDQTHTATKKDVKVIGCKPHIINSDSNFRLIKAMLEAAIAEDKKAGLILFFVCGTSGTTNTTAIDDLPGIADVAKAENIWFHVDAAYAGPALSCPEFRPLAAGSERADSFNFNPYKWMLANFDCSALWVTDCTHLVSALSVNQE
ncbi:hypothetical protein GGI26_004960 [Coemansia sp. RSA 1358]|nr:hypothetical protein GGI26_004960 [Coemansia sp. RSA 1358]